MYWREGPALDSVDVGRPKSTVPYVCVCVCTVLVLEYAIIFTGKARNVLRPETIIYLYRQRE